MSRACLITGNSSGLGRALSEACLQRGWEVYGCSRRGSGGPQRGLHDLRCDLSDPTAIGPMLDELLAGCRGLDLVVLNAGVIGRIKPVTETSVEEIRAVMDVNVWANKLILDWLAHWDGRVRQIVMISSGASVLGNKGWGAYALSKAALNMLARLYSHELGQTHITALAPGLIDSAMMDYLCEEADPVEFPALQRLRQARGTEAMQTPEQAAARLMDVFPELLDHPSGRYIDIREIVAPEEYAAIQAMLARQ